MALSRKNTLRIIAAVLGVVALVFLIFIWFLYSQRLAMQQGLPEALVVPEMPTRLPVQPTSSGLTGAAAEEINIEQPDLEATLKAQASTFAERFGSYSNQSGTTNLTDLQGMMTIRMQAAVATYYEQQRFPGDAPGYWGISTKALSARIVSYDLNFGQAEIRVATQRSETKGTTSNPRVFYQELLVKFVQSGAGWRVDEAQWQ